MNEKRVRRTVAHFFNLLIVLELLLRNKKDRMQLGMYFLNHLRLQRESLGYSKILLSSTYILTCVQIQFKGPSREIDRLLKNMIRNVKLKLEIRNVKAD